MTTFILFLLKAILLFHLSIIFRHLQINWVLCLLTPMRSMRPLLRLTPISQRVAMTSAPSCSSWVPLPCSPRSLAFSINPCKQNRYHKNGKFTKSSPFTKTVTNLLYLTTDLYPYYAPYLKYLNISSTIKSILSFYHLSHLVNSVSSASDQASVNSWNPMRRYLHQLNLAKMPMSSI